jgi:large subunit ribosomal protein L4
MKVDVFDTDNAKAGEIDLSEDIFDAPVREHLFWEVVKWQQAKRRAGTGSAKNRKNVRGGGKKPWQQKGTGRARHGSIRSPLWVGGGVVHGPSPKDWSYSLPRSKRVEALRSALSMKQDADELFVLDSFDFGEIKTKRAVEMLESFGASSALVVDAATENEEGEVEHNDVLRLSVRNLQDVKYIAAEGLNVEDILNHDYLLISQEALGQVQERFEDE